MDTVISDAKNINRDIPTRFQTSAIMALKEAGDAHVVGLLQDMIFSNTLQNSNHTDRRYGC
jgi:hypothetical protein